MLKLPPQKIKKPLDGGWRVWYSGDSGDSEGKKKQRRKERRGKNKMGDGRVRYAYYKNGGQYKKHGLANKRKAYWAKIREAKRIKLENQIKADELRTREWENQIDNLYGNSFNND